MLEWIADLRLGRARHPDPARDRAGHRQHHLYLHPGGRLPEAQRQKARILGWVSPWAPASCCCSPGLGDASHRAAVHRAGEAISGRDLILLLGGLFLIGKSAHEIHATLEGPPNRCERRRIRLHQHPDPDRHSRHRLQPDSVITAVGMADHVPVMVLAIMIAVFIMMFAAKAIGDFVDNHPTIKMLALSFLTLVGFALMAEGMDLHIPKGYIYFAMAFSLTVEMINIRLRSHHDREKLKQE
jgi:predicted tellurium resistance membrane protein TerC